MNLKKNTVAVTSLSARRAWIEMQHSPDPAHGFRVALRKESVDRNNFGLPCILSYSEVALRKESVDRNAEAVPAMTKQAQSLSARRAWIEIHLLTICRKGFSSLSARRAWIEILVLPGYKSFRNSSRSPQGERG